MKKLLTILLCLVISVSLFAQTDVRSLGMGGNHITDYSDIYTVQRNPAGLGLSKNHNLSTNLQVDVSGPLTEIVDIATTYVSNSSNEFMTEEEANAVTEELTNSLINLIKENNGLTLNLDVVGPIQFGFIKNGLGMFFTEDIYADVKVPSVQKIQANVGVTANLILGYGHKLSLGKHSLSLGVSGNIFSDALSLGVDGPATEISNMIQDLSKLKSYSMLGYGIDAGVQYNYGKTLSFGAVYKNIIAPTYTIDMPINEEITLDYANGVKGKLEPSLAVGIGVNIPTKIFLGIVSSWTVYADYDNVLNLIDNSKVSRNPILDFSAGTEIVLLKSIALRAGINESYLSAGCGIRLGSFHVDAAIFGSELGLEPGTKPQLNASVSVSFHK